MVGPSHAKFPRLARIADWRIADRSWRPFYFATSDPSIPAFVGTFGLLKQVCTFGRADSGWWRNADC
eukprot:15469422-Alexandrium_andersonii.AAC.1